MAEEQASFLVALRDGVTAQARRMRSSIKSLRGSLRELQKSSGRDDMGRYLKRSGGLADSLSASFKKMGPGLKSGVIQGVGKLKEGLIVAGAVALGTAAAIGSVVVKFADFAQQSSLGFKAVAKHGASSEKLFAHARAEAELFGLDVMETTKSFKGFLVQGANPAMATNLVRMGADLGAIGASSEQVQSTFLAINKILSQGKLQGDEMMILAEAGVNTGAAYKEMGRIAGKTTDEIRAMQQAGTLTSDIALPGIIGAVTSMSGGKEAGDAGRQLAESTLGGMLGKMKAGIQNMFIDIARSSTPAIMGAFSAITTEIGALMKNKDLQEGIIVAFESMGRFIKDAIPFVKTFVGGLVDGFREAWPAIKGAMDVLFSSFGGKQDWLTTAKDFGKVLGFIAAGAVAVSAVIGGLLATSIQMVTGLIHGAIGAWQAVTGAVGNFVFTISDAFANISAVFESVKTGWWQKMKDIGYYLLKGLAEGIGAAAMIPITAINEMGALLLGKLGDTFKVKSPSEETAWIGSMMAVGLQQGFVHQMRSANDNMGRAAATAIPAIDGPLASSIASAPEIAGAGAAATGGGVYQENHWHITIQQQPGQDATEVADELERRMKRMVDARLEELSIEAA